MLILQINLFRSSPSHSATKSQSSRFGVKLFSRFAHAWGEAKSFFHRGSNPLLAILHIITVSSVGNMWTDLEFSSYEYISSLPEQGAQKCKKYD